MSQGKIILLSDGQLTVLVASGDTPQFTRSNERSSHPTWSSDGTRIVYESGGSGFSHLIIQADAAPRELTPKVSGLFERLIANDEGVVDGVLEDRL